MKPRVYVIDDDPAMTQALAALIDAIGLDNETYASAEEFLHAYDPHSRGCLLLDVRLPDMGGFDLQRHLHALGSRLPVVFMTGHADETVAAVALKNGAVGFLEKPFRPQELFDCLNQAMSSLD